MSDASPITLPTRPRLEAVQGRKRSFGRVFSRIRAVLRRRDAGASKEDVTKTRHDVHNEELASDAAPAVAETEPAEVYAKPSSLLLVDDEDDNVSGTDDGAIVPLERLGRGDCGITEAKAKQFFVRHRLTYHAQKRNQEAEPALKLRRVEKPVRMRVRWTCHSCRAVFGIDKYCLGCGHRRCFECHRDPDRRVKIAELKDTTSGALQPVASTAVQSDAIVSAVEVVHSSSNAPMAKDHDVWRCTIQVGRPRVDSHLMLASSNLSARRHCHECEQPTTSVDQHACHNCKHELCTLCPMISATTEPAAVPVVERVFKKPRQRVRYNCEHCSIPFTNRYECAGCGHERCESCPRYPPRKPQHPDAAVAAVQAKMAAIPLPAPVTLAGAADLSTPLARL